MTTLEEAARNYCACKDRIKALVASLKRCERVAYLEADDRGFDYYYHGTEPQNVGNEYCSRVWVPDGNLGNVKQPEWCQSCKDNLPTVEELRKERRRVGGLASAMMRAYRREVKPCP